MRRWIVMTSFLAAALAFNRDRLCAPSVDAKFGSTSAHVTK
jgi:hypothetical protein